MATQVNTGKIFQQPVTIVSIAECFELKKKKKKLFSSLLQQESGSKEDRSSLSSLQRCPLAALGDYSTDFLLL